MSFNLKNIRTKRQEKVSKRTPLKKAVLNLICAVVLIVLGIISIYLFSAHKLSSQKPAAFKDGEALHIMNHSIGMDEFMLYSIDIKQSYETSYGPDVWSQTTTDTDGSTITYEALAKDNIIQRIRLVKTFLKKSEDERLTISKEEMTTLDTYAQEYYDALVEAGIEGGVITLNSIKNFYYEDYLAQKVYTELSLDKNGEEKDADTLVKECIELINSYDPDFDAETMVNWSLVDALAFGDGTSSAVIKDLHPLDEEKDKEDSKN